MAALRLDRREMLPAGTPRIVDGDTLVLGERRLRLAGLDAPERDQTCLDGQARPYPCGETARDALRALAHGREVACVVAGRDRYGRGLATCSVADRDVGAALVFGGNAVAYGRYGREEADARAARRGLWAGSFDRPDAWRRAHPREPAGR